MEEQRHHAGSVSCRATLTFLAQYGKLGRQPDLEGSKAIDSERTLSSLRLGIDSFVPVSQYILYIAYIGVYNETCFNQHIYDDSIHVRISSTVIIISSPCDLENIPTPIDQIFLIRRSRHQAFLRAQLVAEQQYGLMIAVACGVFIGAADFCFF